MSCCGRVFLTRKWNSWGWARGQRLYFSNVWNGEWIVEEGGTDTDLNLHLPIRAALRVVRIALVQPRLREEHVHREGRALLGRGESETREGLQAVPLRGTRQFKGDKEAMKDAYRSHVLPPVRIARRGDRKQEGRDAVGYEVCEL